MKKLLLWCFTLLSALITNAQDSTVMPHKLTFNGYIKDLQTLTFDKDFSDLIAGNLIHNRINVKWKPSGKITGVAEFRTRLFWGEEVKLTPHFTSLLKNENEVIDMQKIWIENTSLILLTNVERLYFDYSNDKLSLRIGRQRINWGLTTTWNPNDIFNAYNFLDFDYEERPGVDAGKIRYLFGNSSNIEFAYSLTDKKNGSVGAVKYALNKWNYDMQLMAGWYHNQMTAGAGWAGSIKDVGFKGEAQYFFAGKDSLAHLNVALEGDYMFKKGWYLNLGILFNNRGLNKPVSNWSNLDFVLSPENLMPTKWNLIVTGAREITPLLSVNVTVLYSPGTNLTIFYPSIQYNIATNLDVNFVWQSFYAGQDHGFEAVNHRAFVRLKWNF
ncbi:hypothetical protein HGH93_08660 [Chitinophaga polysaccharea]|uniref:hypothetical protein n=1 Tax=Chitinophaga TaxID=79328 RepID=UPI00145589ED|nr:MULTISPECIES: hypothetical protein [Chitinophaga]NLR58166.1 hypothetical protein [Chitinophaga polysaccharea]NLU90690.1 hypothetical protein [Chitinophaga sp. Ak27]